MSNPFANQQHQQQPQQQQGFQVDTSNQGQGQGQGQQQDQGNSFANNIGNLMSNPLMSIGGNMAANQAQELLKKTPFLTKNLFSQNSRYYFDVDAQYVIRKLKVLFAPFLEKGNWDKTMEGNLGHSGYLSPVQDLHAPDLYIPLMSLMTFILISCLSVGIGDEFQPEVIQQNLTKSIFISIIELSLFKLGFFLININVQGGYIESALDLVSHLNYRYIYLVVILISRLLLGSWITFLVVVYLFGCSILFVYKTLQRYESGVGEEEFKSKIMLLLSILQALFSYILLNATGAY